MFNGKRVAVIIAAGGLGSRLGTSVPKQFLKIGGRPVIVKATEAFDKMDAVDYIFVATRDEYLDYCRELLEEHKLTKVESVVSGGSKRQDSVFKALQEMNRRTPGVEYVLIHDGARPYLHSEALNDLKEKLSQNDCVVLGRIATDTIKLIDGETVVETIDRNKVFQAETPQGFKTELIKNAYENCADINFTDDCSLVESLGYKVAIVIDRFENKKLTKEEDFRNL